MLVLAFLRRLVVAAALIAAAFVLTGEARAAGGNYAFTGGTAAQRDVVRAALDASTFPWGVVPQKIQIQIAPGIASEASPGVIALDSNLLDQGSFAWGIVQHEYAHQVDFLLIGSAGRAALQKALGSTTWCWADNPSLDHAAYGCERFASVLAWSYWRSGDNCLAPTSATDEAGVLAPAAFKRLLGQILTGKQPTPVDSTLAIGRSPRSLQAQR